jgi:O-antigen/teichoic acid export membrane protein
VKLSEHLDKGFWALADRGLPFVYAVAQIVVARVLGLEEYGTYVVFQVIFNMLFAFTDNFALQAIVKYGVEPGINVEALISSTTSLFLGFLLPILLLFNLFPHLISDVLGNTHLAQLFPLLALYVIVSAPRVIYSKVLQMRFRMRDIFFVDLANFGLGGLLLAIGLAQHVIQHADQVIWRTVIAAIVSSAVAVWFGSRHVGLRFEYSRPMFTRIRDFVRYQGATGLVSVLQQNIDTLAVSSFTGALGAGAYGGAKNVYRLFDVMRDTVTLLVFPATSKYYSRNETETVRTIIEKAVGFLYLILIPLSILLFVLAPVFYHLVFGPKFDSSIPIFRILVVGSLVLPIQMVFISTMVGMGRVKEMFRIISTGLTLNVIVTLVLLPTIGIAGAAISFVIGNAIQAFLAFKIIKKKIGFNARELPRLAFSDASNFIRATLKSRKAH